MASRACTYTFTHHKTVSRISFYMCSLCVLCRSPTLKRRRTVDYDTPISQLWTPPNRTVDTPICIIPDAPRLPSSMSLGQQTLPYFQSHPPIFTCPVQGLSLFTSHPPIYTCPFPSPTKSRNNTHGFLTDVQPAMTTPGRWITNPHSAFLPITVY